MKTRLLNKYTSLYYSLLPITTAHCKVQKVITNIGFLATFIAFSTTILPLQSQVLTIGSNVHCVISGNTYLILNNGGIKNNGLFYAGTGTVVFSGAGFTIDTGTAAIAYYNILLSGNGTKVNSNNVSVAGLVTVSGTTVLDTDGYGNNKGFTLRSTADSTASVAQANPLGGYIVGNVTVERYISSSVNRAYRQLAPMVTTTTSVFQNWMESGNDLAGYDTHITGSKSLTALNDVGLDPTATGQTSLYTLNGTQTAWDKVTNTKTLTLDATKGYLIYVRGDRSINLASNSSTNNTTLRAIGTLKTGNQTIAVGSAMYNYIANPYASAINWATIYSNTANNNLGNANFVYYDPNVNPPSGSYVSASNLGVVSNISASQTNPTIIQSGQAFWVYSNTSSMVIREADKSTINNRDVYRTNNGQIENMHISLFFTSPEYGRRSADGILAEFGNDFSAAIDQVDAPKFANFYEDIAILRDGKNLAIEARPLVDHADTLPLYIAKMKVQPYELQFDPANFNAPGLQAYLQDKFLTSETAISLSDRTIVPFTITSNAASKASDRFKVVFRSMAVLPVNFTQLKAFKKGPAIQVEWNVATETGVKLYEIEKSTNGRSFIKGGTQAVRNISSTDNYVWLDEAPGTGNNYYRIKALEQNGTRFSSIVLVKSKTEASGITIFPNPVTNGTVSLHFATMAKGIYTAKLVNVAGQLLLTRQINNLTGSLSQNITIPSIGQGLYYLQIMHPGSETSLLKMLVK